MAPGQGGAAGAPLPAKEGRLDRLLGGKEDLFLIGSSEKQRRLVTFLSYLHCRSLWIVSRLLSSSIWHKNN